MNPGIWALYVAFPAGLLAFALWMYYREKDD